MPTFLPTVDPTTQPTSAASADRGDRGKRNEQFNDQVRGVLSPALAWLVVAAGGVGAAALVSRSAFVAIAFVVACGLLLSFASRPTALAIAIVAAVPITSGLRRGLPVPGLRVSEGLIVVAALIVLLRPAPPSRPHWTSLDWAVAAYTLVGPAIGLLDLIGSGRSADSSSLQSTVGPVQFLLLYRVLAVALRGERSQRVAQRAFLLSTLPVSVLAITESLGPRGVQNFLVSLTGTTVYVTPGWTPVPRASSVFPIWLSLAGYLLVPMLLAVALLLGRVHDVLPRWTLLVILVLGFAGLLASLTITIAAALCVGTLYLGYRYRRLFVVLSTGCILALILVVPFWSLILQRVNAQHQSAHATAHYPFLPQTIAYRVQIWIQQYLPAIKGHWATGYGPGFPPGVEWGHTESGYITLLLGGGLPYLAMAAVLLWFVMSRARAGRASCLSGHRRALCEAVFVIAAIQVLINLTYPYMINGGLAQPMWVLFGLLGAGHGWRQAADDAEPSPSNRRRAAIGSGGPRRQSRLADAPRG